MKVLVFPVLLAIAIMVGPPKMAVGPVAKTATAQPALALKGRSEAALAPVVAAAEKNTITTPENRLTDKTDPLYSSSTARR